VKTQTCVYDVCRHYVTDYSCQLGDALTNKLLGLIRNRDLPKLAAAGDLFDQAKHDRYVFTHLRQISAFFKKNAVFVSVDCNETALKTFDKAERLCRITNRRLDHYFTKRDRLDPDLDKWMTRAERFIRSVLGEYSHFLEDLPSRIRITSGASATSNRRDSLPVLKLRRRISATHRSIPYLDALAVHFGYKQRFIGKEWNRVETVPKNWKTARTIACEQEGNIPLQLAFDDYCKERLRIYAKIDLRDQSRNQNLSKQGSIDGSLSTIDLSMASDTLSYNAVAWLLPEQWFNYLTDVRASYYRLNNDIKKYAKFSSMGNGATFALETLIFASACYAVGSKAYSVYGDDIVIETELYSDLIRMLSFLGFTVNKDKSYNVGPFRESCGTDWYLGHNVTPFYLRDWASCKKLPLISHNINGLAAICYPGGALEHYLLDLYEQNQKAMPLVPFNNVSTSGIYIDIYSAYKLKLFHNRLHHKQVVYYKCLVSNSKTRMICDSRSLFLWFLDKNRRRLEDDDSVVIRSRVPMLSHKYVRKWVCWNPPAQLTPVHLYRWTELVISRLNGVRN